MPFCSLLKNTECIKEFYKWWCSYNNSKHLSSYLKCSMYFQKCHQVWFPEQFSEVILNIPVLHNYCHYFPPFLSQPLLPLGLDILPSPINSFHLLFFKKKFWRVHVLSLPYVFASLYLYLSLIQFYFNLAGHVTTSEHTSAWLKPRTFGNFTSEAAYIAKFSH